MLAHSLVRAREGERSGRERETEERGDAVEREIVFFKAPLLLQECVAAGRILYERVLPAARELEQAMKKMKNAYLRVWKKELLLRKASDDAAAARDAAAVVADAAAAAASAADVEPAGAASKGAATAAATPEPLSSSSSPLLSPHPSWVVKEELEKLEAWGRCAQNFCAVATADVAAETSAGRAVAGLARSSIGSGLQGGGGGGGAADAAAHAAVEKKLLDLRGNPRAGSDGFPGIVPPRRSRPAPGRAQVGC